MVDVRFGWAVPTFGGGGDSHIDTPCVERVDRSIYEAVANVAVLCEELGYDSVWLADHVTLCGDRGILECWTTLCALASLTKKVRLGTLGLTNEWRHPSIAAKMAATLDVISGGRLDYGVKAVWSLLSAGGGGSEHLAYGLPWPGNTRERVKQITEALIIAKRMWTEDRPSFKGKYYEVREAICEPKPLQKPHPPIWVEGAEEEFTLRMLAEHGDGWNYVGSVELYKHKLGVLMKHCSDIGRSLASIRVSWFGHVVTGRTKHDVKALIRLIKEESPRYPLNYEEGDGFMKENLVGTVDDVIKRIDAFIDVGVQDFMLWFLDFPSTNTIRFFAENVLPSFK